MKTKILAADRARDPVHYDYVPLPIRALIRTALRSGFNSDWYARLAAKDIENLDPQLDGLLQRVIDREADAEDCVWVASYVLGVHLMTAVTLVLAAGFADRSMVRFAFEKAMEKGDALKIAANMLGEHLTVQSLLDYIGASLSPTGKIVYVKLPTNRFTPLLADAIWCSTFNARRGSAPLRYCEVLAEHIQIELDRKGLRIR